MSSEPLAVIGWSHKFPGDASTSDGFWEMLCSGCTAHQRVPQNRFNVNAFYHPDYKRSGSMNVTHAHFLKQDLAAFDAPFFAIQRAEAVTMDPQQRLLLEVAYHAFESAGLPVDSVKGSNTSVYVGASTHDYESIYNRDPENSPPYLGTGIGGSIIPNRISWFFDLHGESLHIDTACSSSLTCLHLADQALRSGSSDMALVGGVNLMITPDSSFFHLSNMGFMSPDGRSYSFDERGNGYAKGEGAAIVILKRVSDAIRDGDTIRAILRATGTNQDGRTPGITQPSQRAQESNIRTTHKRHGIDFDTIGYIEAHGTGTQVGDPIECAAIANTIGRDAQNPLFVGAVKTNVGHLEAVAGLAGLIKTIMILEKGVIPPNALYNSPNKNIPVNRWDIKFPTEVTLWPTKGLRRASVNSFGYGGTNAYAILDDAIHYLQQHSISARHNTVEEPLEDRNLRHDMTNGHSETNSTQNEKLPKIFIWSAADEAGVKRVTDCYKEYLKTNNISEFREGDFLQNLSYTLSSKRSALPWKSFVVADSIQCLQDSLDSQLSKPVRSSDPPALVFIFTGQGAQWFAMGRELINYSSFEETLQRAEQVLQTTGHAFSPKQELLKDRANSRIDEPLMSQTLCTILQLALVDLLASMDIHPDAVIGHSSGEVAAAYCAGGLDFESAVLTAFWRGHYMSSLLESGKSSGAMIAVSLSAKDVQPLLKEAMATGNGMLVIACENSPNSVTIAGDIPCVGCLNSMMEQRGVFAKQLPIPLAYHSPHMNAIGNEYKQSLVGIQPRKDRLTGKMRHKIPLIFSSVTGARIDVQCLSDPEHWVAHLVSTVRFSDALISLARHLKSVTDTTSGGCRTQILEIGPHAALKRPVKEILDAAPGVLDASYDHLLERNISALSSCLQAMGRLACAGFRIDLSKVNAPFTSRNRLRQLVNLPEYPFNHSQTYWSESRISKNFRFRASARHELLGVPSSDWNNREPHWRHFLKSSENPWMMDHAMDSVNVYPAAGMVVMVIEAARQLGEPLHAILGYHLTNLQFMQALKLKEAGEGLEVQLRFHQSGSHAGDPLMAYDFSMYVFVDDDWTTCCSGSIALDIAIDKKYESRYHVGGFRTRQLSSKRNSLLKACTESVSTKTFYQNMTRQRFQLGPAHQTLEAISFSRASPKATGRISLDSWLHKCNVSQDHVQPHVIHPTDLDGILQLAMAAFTQGGSRPVPTMVPTDCRSMWISNRLLTRTTGSLLDCFTENTFTGFREADFNIMAFDGQSQPIFAAEGFRQMAITNLDISTSSQTEVDRVCYTTKWDLDIELMSADAIRNYCGQRSSHESHPSFDVTKFELISLYYTSKLTGLAKSGAHLHGFGSHTLKYLDWAERTYHKEQLDKLILEVPGATKLTQDQVSRDMFLDWLATTNIECGLTNHVGKNLCNMLEGKLDPLEVVYDPTFIRDFYQGPSFQRSFDQIKAFVRLLGHKNPSLKILEIGAGTASGTVSLLEALAPTTSQGALPKLPLFARYDFTDISPQYFEQAREVLSHFSPFFNYATLDIERDPVEQGFTEGLYDLVYAGMVLHVTSDISKSLQNARKLLRPGGKLIYWNLPISVAPEFISSSVFSVDDGLVKRSRENRGHC